jgi:hypothetical protein
MKSAYSFSVFAVAFTACTLSPFSLGDGTKGERGALTFEYSSSQCVFGCALDRPVLLGSMITIQAHGGDPAVRTTLSVLPAAPGSTTSRELCSCERRSSNSASARSVEPDAACAAGETKSCRVSLDLEARMGGVANIVASDAHGAILDSARFEIAPADRIVTTAKVNGKTATPGSDGAFAVRVGDRIAVHSEVSSGGRRMVFTKHGIQPVYSDAAVVGPDARVLVGATDTEDARAVGPGRATLALAAEGATAVVTFDVSR